MKRTPVLIAIAAWSLLLAGCASAGGSSSSSPSAAVSIAEVQASSSADSPSPSTSAQRVAACTSRSCITQEAELTLPGEQSTDGSVITKATCYQSTVKHNPNNIYTVSCDATYTDGSVWSGLATIQPDSDQFSWQPQSEVS
jgi:hypothetical protein